MAIICPEKIGEEKVLARFMNKVLITQDFKNPKTDTTVTWGLLKGLKKSSMILPITSDHKVIAIRQFRYGANEVVLELPGGNVEGGQSPEDAARAELLQETGYEVGELVPLSPEGIFIEPSAISEALYVGFLGLDCVFRQAPILDSTEDIEVVLISFDEWIQQMYDNPCKVNSVLALTFLALSHLGISYSAPARFSGPHR